MGKGNQRARGNAPRPRSGHGAAYLPAPTTAPTAEVYVMGGWDGRTSMFGGVYCLQLERHSPRACTDADLRVNAAWANVKCQGPEPAKRSCFGFAALSQPRKLVAFGGLDEAWQPLPVWEVHLLDLHDKVSMVLCSVFDMRCYVCACFDLHSC